MGGLHHAPVALPPKGSRYPLYRKLGGPQWRSGWVREISPPPGFDPRTVQPVASRYTGWTILVPCYRMGVTGMWSLLGCYTVPNRYVITRNGNWLYRADREVKDICDMLAGWQYKTGTDINRIEQSSTRHTRNAWVLRRLCGKGGRCSCGNNSELFLLSLKIRTQNTECAKSCLTKIVLTVQEKITQQKHQRKPAVTIEKRGLF
jgi:hypothetical protein